MNHNERTHLQAAEEQGGAVTSTSLCLGGLGFDCRLATVYIHDGFPQSVQPNTDIDTLRQATITFRSVRIVAKSAYQLRHVSLSVCPQISARLPLDEFP